MKWRLEWQILFALAFALVVLIGLAISSYRSVAGMLQASKQVTHTRDVMDELDAVLSALKDAETAQRGFLLTDRDAFLEPYNQASPMVGQHILLLRQLVNDNPEQRRRLDQAEQLATAKLELIRKGIEVRQSREDGQRVSIQTLEQGKQVMDDARRVIAEMKEVENKLLTVRQQQAAAAARQTLLIIPLVSLLAVGVTAFAFIAIYRELTRRQRAEVQTLTLNQELGRSNRELQDFAYVASHDLQEPLRKIQAFGDRLKSKYGPALNDEGRDYLDRMQNSARRMHTLINDLLEYSRVATKGQPFTPVDLNQVASDVLGDLEVRVQQSGGRVEMGELPVMDADPLQMRQLLQNLIGNALKFYRPEQPPVVRVTAEGTEDGLCLIAVADNGIGFEEKYLDRIFTPFQRLHGRSEYEGTGMGLAVCRRIAERHGGTITAQSTPGQGTTFLVTLPLKQNGDNP
ncbi:MAG: CHASE3 domain-containing protein [Acidobacteriota bacterium]|nr:CHASE3 domain-containing protein [Acidobacteriota bacterium]